MFNKAVITAKGLALDAKVSAGQTNAVFTAIKLGNGTYNGIEDLSASTNLKSIKQTFVISSIVVIENNTVRLRSVIDNLGVEEGYYISEVGIYAQDPDYGEILYSIATGVKNKMDYQPSETELEGATSTFDTYTKISNSENASITMGTGAMASAEDVEELRNGKVDKTGGDISETVIKTLDTIEDKYPVPSAGENVKRFFGKVLTFLRNIKPLTGDITLYVSANTGTDITGDGTQANPFKTIQHAINMLPKDLGGNFAIIEVAIGTYDENLLINGFYNGALFFNSANKDTYTDTCKVNSVDIKYCSAYVYMNGFNITTAVRDGFIIWGCHNVRLFYCQVLATSSYGGFYFGESIGRVTNCKVANHYVVLSSCNSQVYSGAWDAGSTGNDVGLSCYTGSTMYLSGTQPVATLLRTQTDGGQFVFQNGTQISDLITSGLSCTWGTLSGGYYRYGNVSGTAMVTVNIQVTLTSQLSAGTLYSILGFPPASYISVPVNCQVLDHFNYYILTTGGQLQLKPQTTLQVGNVYQFSVTYRTS